MTTPNNIEAMETIKDIHSTTAIQKTIYSTIEKITSPEENSEFYDYWAKAYEQDVVRGDYNSWRRLAEAVVELIKERSLDTKTTKILDVCAGTGLVSFALKENGYDGEIDALDGSVEMLKIAKEKNLYNNYICELICEDRNLRHVSSNYYDILCTTGSFCPGHLKPNALRTLCDLIKPGGFYFMLINAALLDHPYLDGLLEMVDTMVDEKLWIILKSQKIPRYFNGNDGLLYVCQKL